MGIDNSYKKFENNMLDDLDLIGDSLSKILSNNSFSIKYLLLAIFKMNQKKYITNK